MATYAELFSLQGDKPLLELITVAVIIAAHGIMVEPSPSAQRKAWASKAFNAPGLEAIRFMPAMLAANAGASVATIQGASDAQIQTNVDDAINLFIDADAGI